MGWRDFIVSSQSRSSTTPLKDHSVGFVDFVSRYEKKNSLYIENSSHNSIPPNASTKHTEPIPAKVVNSPFPPLQPNWLVVYHDRRVLRGGCDDREHGTVQYCEWDGTAWTVCLTDGQRLPLHAVRSVAQTNDRGEVVAAWTVREHGFSTLRNELEP
jgi:hypothetical protein